MTLRPLAAPSARNRITISKNCWRKGGDLFCFLNNENVISAVMRRQDADASRTRRFQCFCCISAACVQATAELRRSPFSRRVPPPPPYRNNHTSHTARATSLVKVAGGVEGWTCVSYRHLLHDTQGLSRHVRATARHLSLHVSKSILTTCSWAVWMD